MDWKRICRDESSVSLSALLCSLKTGKSRSFSVMFEVPARYFQCFQLVISPLGKRERKIAPKYIFFQIVKCQLKCVLSAFRWSNIWITPSCIFEWDVMRALKTINSRFRECRCALDAGTVVEVDKKHANVTLSWDTTHINTFHIHANGTLIFSLNIPLWC